MKAFGQTIVIAAVALATAFDASAHAFLERATPGVGATIATSPSELQLSFTQDVVVALSGARIAAVGGGSVPVAKPTANGESSPTLTLRLGRALGPGTYVVTWHVVSVDTHPTSGSYKFTVAP